MVKSCFCGDAGGACAQRQAWLLCPVSDNVDHAFVKVTAPTTPDVPFDLVCPAFAPRLQTPLFCHQRGGLHWSAFEGHDPLNMFNVQFAKRPDRSPQKGWQTAY